MGIIPDNEVEEVREHFFKPSYKNMYGGHDISVWAYNREAKLVRESGGCHANLMTPLTGDKFSYLASNGPHDHTSDRFSTGGMKSNIGLDGIVEDFMRWITGPESSWKNVHQNDIELIEMKDGRIKAFVLGPKALEDRSKRGGIYNLLVAARMPREYGGWFKNYEKLRELGLNQAQSFLLMPIFSFNKDTNIWVSSGSPIVWDGSHKPFQEKIYDYYEDKNNFVKILNTKAVLTGDYDFRQGTVRNSSHGWFRKRIKQEPILSKAAGTFPKVKTRFSQLNSVPQEFIVELGKKLSNEDLQEFENA